LQYILTAKQKKVQTPEVEPEEAAYKPKSLEDLERERLEKVRLKREKENQV
jgi:hypothetical protein